MGEGWCYYELDIDKKGDYYVGVCKVYEEVVGGCFYRFVM